MVSLALLVTYFGFHCRFNFPLLGLLLAWNLWFPFQAGELAAAGIVLAVVLVFTSPWDNAAARAGIWGFPRQQYSWALGWLPVEEYLFFLLQSLNVMAFCRILIHSTAWFRTGLAIEVTSPVGIVAGVVLLAWLLWGIVLWRWRPRRRWHYATHLFFWFGPVILLQWIIAGPLFLAQGFLLVLAMGAWGTYYVLADVVAVRHGVWHFDVTQTEGRQIAGVLPWEEAAFFYLTSLLVAQSYLLLLPAGQR